MAKKKELVLKNHVALVIDESGSMAFLRDKVIEQFNQQLEKLAAEAKKAGQETDVTIYTFGNTPKRLAYATNIDRVKPLTNNDYFPHNNTALNDAIGQAIEDLRKLGDEFQENVSFLVIIITDGQENWSVNYEAAGLRIIIDKLQRQNFSFMFMCPPGAKRKIVSDYGVAYGNVLEWEATYNGLETATQHTNSGVSSYFVGRTQGVRSFSNLYETNLANVAPAQVKAALVDVTSMFRKMTVDREASIQAFIEYKTNKDYRIGDGFYELTKKEKIQPHKEILVLDRSDNKLYAGNAARDLLGLPKDKEFRVAPGNHANYKIFVQSKSPNRKLVRGTTLYYKKAA